MVERLCPGLPADWLNAWLAAVGVTVLVPEARLGWSDDPVPLARFESPTDITHLVATAWPNEQRLTRMPIAEHHPEASRPMGRQVDLDTWHERAPIARRDPDGWTLSSTVTDLAVGRTGMLLHAPLDPPGPGTIKWLHHRLTKTAGFVPDPDSVLGLSFDGTAGRVNDNGLGFDGRRFGATADSAKKRVDPAIEVLAFFGLALLTVRGDGREGDAVRARQRGWGERSGRTVFRYPVWEQALDRWAIDSILDCWGGLAREGQSRLGVHRTFETVAYRRKTGETSTSAYLGQPSR